MIQRPLLFALLLIGLSIGSTALSYAVDKDQQGPGAFYYLQYHLESWKVPGSDFQINKKSKKIGICIGGMALYLFVRKKWS